MTATDMLQARSFCQRSGNPKTARNSQERTQDSRLNQEEMCFTLANLRIIQIAFFSDSMAVCEVYFFELDCPWGLTVAAAGPFPPIYSNDL